MQRPEDAAQARREARVIQHHGFALASSLPRLGQAQVEDNSVILKQAVPLAEAEQFAGPE
jgi:hypothetical protein